MKRNTKYKLMTGLLAGTVFIGGWKLGTVHALASNDNEPVFSVSPTEVTEETTEEIQNQQSVDYTEQSIEQKITMIDEKPTLEEFLSGIEDKQVKKFYTKLYELYDYNTFDERSEIPQYFQTIYVNKFSCGTIQSAGCGISSLAMVSSYLFDEIITPDMMTIYDSGPSPATAFEKGIKRLNLNCEVYRGQAAIDNLDAALEEGHPVIALMGRASIFTETGHFIVIAGKTPDGKYTVNDPNLENLYKPNLIEGFTNGFTKTEVTRGIKGIYIFDTKEQFKDKRDKELNFKINQSSTTESIEFDNSSFIHIKYNDLVVTNSALELKTSPVTSSNSIKTIKENTELKVIAIVNNEWLTIIHNNQIGYIPINQVTSLLERAQTLYPELELTELNPLKTVYLSTDINLRCGNSIEFDAISILKEYETVRVLGEYKDWYFVITNEHNFGFIPKKYTKEIKDQYIIVDKSEQQTYYYNDGNPIYTSPSMQVSLIEDGIYEVLTKTNNIVIIDSNSGQQMLYNSNSQIYNDIETGTKVLIHK